MRACVSSVLFPSTSVVKKKKEMSSPFRFRSATLDGYVVSDRRQSLLADLIVIFDLINDFNLFDHLLYACALVLQIGSQLNALGYFSSHIFCDRVDTDFFSKKLRSIYCF